MNVLTALRIYGPCDLVFLAGKIREHTPPGERLTIHEVGNHLWNMHCHDGRLATYDANWCWDLTELGRGLFTSHLSARRRDRECTGVGNG